MKIIGIFIHRKESYDGQHAPELFEAVDEFTNDDNPDWLKDKMKVALDSLKEGEFDIVKKLEFDIPQKEFDKIFFEDNKINVPSIKEVEGANE